MAVNKCTNCGEYFFTDAHNGLCYKCVKSLGDTPEIFSDIFSDMFATCPLDVCDTFDTVPTNKGKDDKRTDTSK